MFINHGADTLEDAIWSARRNTVTGYGIGVFDLDPGGANEPTTITMRYYHAPGAEAGASDYELFDTVVLAKKRRGEVGPKPTLRYAPGDGSRQQPSGP